jgi:zinc finger protein ZFPM1
LISPPGSGQNLKLFLFHPFDRTSIAPVANPDSACFIFQNGSLQPIAISLAPAPSSSANAQQSTPSRTPSATPQNPGEAKSKPSSSSNNSGTSQTGEVLKSVNKRDNNGR